MSKKALRAFQQWGKSGGKKRAKNLSSSARQSISGGAAEVRWGQKKTGETPMSSVRLEGAFWADPVYLEEILSHGNLSDWKKLRRKIADRPFGVEAAALEKVLRAVDIYGTISLWNGILNHLRGILS